MIDEVLDEYCFKVMFINGVKWEIWVDCCFEVGDEVYVLIWLEDLCIEFLKDVGDWFGFIGKILECSYIG